MSAPLVIYTRIPSDPRQPFWHIRLPVSNKSMCGRLVLPNNDAPGVPHVYTEDEHEGAGRTPRLYCQACHAVAAAKAGLANPE